MNIMFIFSLSCAVIQMVCNKSLDTRNAHSCAAVSWNIKYFLSC